MIESLHFLRPQALFLLVPAVGLVWAIARRRDAWRKWQDLLAPHLLQALLVYTQRRRESRPLLLLAFALLLGIVALAGPAWRQQPVPFAQDTAALVIVLKVTPSMLAQDVQPSRLERARQKIQELLEQRPGARAALVAYAGSAHLVMPLTRDISLIDTFAAALHPDIMPREGDDPAAALALAARQLDEAHEKGSVLWVGDGLAGAEAERIVLQDTQAVISLVMLGTVWPDGDGPERRELEHAASVLGARLVFVAPDARDVDSMAAGVAANFAAAMESDGGTRWQDEGYWLMFPLVLLALLWFRTGWVVRYR